MSFWTSNPHKSDAELAENLAHAPSGGCIRMCLLGVGLALVPIGYGIRCLLTGHATFIGSRGVRIELTDSSATAMAIAYIAVGTFIHAHWFWGLHPRLNPLSPVIKTLSVLAFLGGLGYTACKILSL